MAIIAKAEATYEKAPCGMQQAVCAFVDDIGTQVGEYQGKPNARHQVIITWELAEKQSDGEPFLLSKFYTLSLNEKANLRKDLASWRGKDFSEEEARGFDVERLVGVNCFLNITATDKDKRAISAITPLPKNLPTMPLTVRQKPERYAQFIAKKKAESLEAKSEVGHSVDTGDGAGKVDDGLPF